MTAILLNLTVTALALAALWRGWRRGVALSMPSLLAWALALASTVILAPMLAEKLLDGGIDASCQEPTMASLYLAATLIFGGVSLVIGLLTMPLVELLGLMGHGPLGSIAGSIFTLLRWLTMISMLLNTWCAADPYCTPLRLADGGDGSLVEGVMWIAPALTGFPDFHEMVHRRQLKEARSISLNIRPDSRVVLICGLAGHREYLRLPEEPRLN